jgi:hypothetical protein
MRMHVLTAAGTTTILALLCFVRPGSANILAVASQLSSPPARTLLVDVQAGTIGGLKLKTPASTYVRTLGIPDFIGQVESAKDVEMVWTKTAQPGTGWATATLQSAQSTTVVQMRFSGLFDTSRGDRRGTNLSTFLRHWQSSNPVVSTVLMDGRVVEYNVILGHVVFAFDKPGLLEAVGLAAPGAGRSLCVIPSSCVVARFK